jgi:SAM-dependent methyltransferase
LVCIQGGHWFPIVHGRPVLLRHDNEIFTVNDYQHAQPPEEYKAPKGLSRLIPASSVNLSSSRIFSALKGRLMERGLPAVVLVVGAGSQRRWLDDALGARNNAISVVYSDIDISADVDLFCDGHELPFQDNAFDAVVTTAVLEHVLYPERVASEIVRVLKREGVLYSELPFMQQVHEGAYDFTRYTLSGHRRLFNAIVEIESGIVAGPGTSLVWAIEHFFLAFISRPVFKKMTKSIVRILFFWLKYFDYLLANNPQAMDGASCTYLFGYKADKPCSDSEIIARYVGGKSLQHK